MAEEKHRDMWREIYSDEESRKKAFSQRFVQWKNSLVVTITIILLAISGISAIATIFFPIVWDVTFGHDFDASIPLRILKLEALSNLKRNDYLLLFGVFALALATWARIAQQTQIRQTKDQIAQTEDQIDGSREISRNDRFAKAVEMLDKDKIGDDKSGTKSSAKSDISYRAGLYMLHDLVTEKPEKEYIRCTEVTVDWLKKVTDIDMDIKRIAMDIISFPALEYDEEKELRDIIEKHKSRNPLHLWPNLIRGNFKKIFMEKINLKYANLFAADLQSATLPNADLEGAFLRNAILDNADFTHANLKDANLGYANLHETFLIHAKLEGAFISVTNMERARELKKEQILSATWQDEYGEGNPPKLPDYLLRDDEGDEDPDIQEWLEKPPFLYEYFR